MTRTVYYAASTLDGFLADEHDSLDWLLHQDIDPEGSGGNDAFMRSVGAIVMGRAIYMWLHDHLEADGDGWPYTVPSTDSDSCIEGMMSPWSNCGSFAM